MLFLIGIVFAPIGGLLIWGSNQVTEITLDYTNCDSAAPTDGSTGQLEKYDCACRAGSSADKGLELMRCRADALSSGHSSAGITPPRWTFSNDSTRAVGEQARCSITFDVPYDLSGWYRRQHIIAG